MSHPTDLDDRWPQRLAGWQALLDEKWKGQIERSFLVLTRLLVWSYVIAVPLVWLLFRVAGDRWWPTTLLLFGPRWLGLLPLVLLVPLSLVVRVRLLLPLAAATLLFVFGVMGFCLPIRSFTRGPNHAPQLAVLTCNVNGGAVNTESLQYLLLAESPDLVTWQECGSDVSLPFPQNWHIAREGQIVIASPHPIRDMRTWYRLDPPAEWPPLLAVYALVDCPDKSVAVCSIHLTSPHHGLSEVLDRHTVVRPSRANNLQRLNSVRAQESTALAAWLDSLPQVDLVLGDFNMPVESAIYRATWSRYRNSFSTVGFGLGYTRWVQIHNLSYGARIDHILTTADWTPISCYVGRDIGSDHLPLVARFALPPQAAAGESSPPRCTAE